MSLTLSFAAAASAPLRMVSQKVSPEGAWVTIAIVMRGVVALPAETLPASSSACFPPELLEQPARVRAAAAATATAGTILRERGSAVRFIRAPHCASGREGGSPAAVRPPGGPGWRRGSGRGLFPGGANGPNAARPVRGGAGPGRD